MLTITVPDVGLVVVVVVPVPGVVDVAPTVAVTVAVTTVCRIVVARPFVSVLTVVASSDPAVVENDTCAPGSGLPLMSKTEVEIVDAPPIDGSSVGFAFTETRPTAAVPTAILTAFAVGTLAPPDRALMIAVPFEFPALKVTMARPAESVCASEGSIVPRLVVKVTSVPLCGGVPDASITWAMSCVVPFTGSAVVEAVREIVEPLGASSGTLEQVIITRAALTRKAGARNLRLKRDNMKTITILVPMKLAGQASRSSYIRTRQDGYAMAALLIAMSVMAIMMTAVMPVWRHQAQREKEEELVFRGLQCVHAIGLFQRKYANAYPPSIDVLVEQRFLRKKFKDPITNDDFVPIGAGQSAPGSTPNNANTARRRTRHLANHTGCARWTRQYARQRATG